MYFKYLTIEYKEMCKQQSKIKHSKFKPEI